LNILVFNCGSSSLNYKVFTLENKELLSIICKGKAHRVGVKGTENPFIEHTFNDCRVKHETIIDNHAIAADLIFDYLYKKKIKIDIIGHRFVHGGENFKKSCFINEQNYQHLKACSPLAPIHNPNSLSIIDLCREKYPEIPQYATFDTAFHSNLPKEAYIYAISSNLNQGNNYRKFGFHGLSYQYVVQKACEYLKSAPKRLKIIACHLGTGGSSITAIRNDQSIETSMGFTPLQGLVMSTRSGDLDSIIPIHMVQSGQFSTQSLNKHLNKQSGLLGLSGFSSDIRDIILKADQGDSQAKIALEIYVERLKSYIGAYYLLMQGCDLLIFTDDVGIWCPRVRDAVCADMAWCGIEVDPLRNDSTISTEINEIQSDKAEVKIIAMPTDEELIIGMEGYKLVSEAQNDLD
jgi:acetate kinase